MKYLSLFLVFGSILLGCDDKQPNINDAGDLICENKTTKCGDFCVDLNSDIYNCGSCGHNCSTDLVNATGLCNGSGKCHIQKCDDGWADCDGRNPPFDPNTQWEPTGTIIESGQENGCETKIIDTKNRCAAFDAGK